jgi:hypothetical protein
LKELRDHLGLLMSRLDDVSAEATDADIDGETRASILAWLDDAADSLDRARKLCDDSE